MLARDSYGRKKIKCYFVKREGRKKNPNPDLGLRSLPLSILTFVVTVFGCSACCTVAADVMLAIESIVYPKRPQIFTHHPAPKRTGDIQNDSDV